MSKIEWTNKTWNPFTGCTKVSPGCDHCYMFTMYPRLKAMGAKGYEESPDVVQVHDERFAQPAKWVKPMRIFVNSMSDTFHPHIEYGDLDYLYNVMERANHHIFQVLTKRPGRAADWWKWASTHVDDPFQAIPWPAHIHLGTSVESQKYAPRIEVLARVPAPVKFVSAEPLLGPLDLTSYLEQGLVQWLIVGGESGPGARPMDPDWARSLRDQAKEYGVPFFMKQMARKQQIPNDLFIREYPEKGEA